jgi:hypothetical protein
MKTEVPLTQGYIAIVDAEDAALVAGHRWSAFKARGKVYAVRTRVEKPRMVFMHRLILGAPQGITVDHVDGDGLNNTRANLRLATVAQNCRNTPKKRDASSTSRYKGVGYRATEQSWRAKITVNRKRVYLGNFHSEMDAARAYDAAARRYFGEFALLNFPGEPAISLEEALSRTRSKLAEPKGFRGVTAYRDGRRWLSCVYLENSRKRIHLGIFATAEEAARAHDQAVVEMGLNKPLNFPRS